MIMFVYVYLLGTVQMNCWFLFYNNEYLPVHKMQYDDDADIWLSIYILTTQQQPSIVLQQQQHA